MSIFNNLTIEEMIAAFKQLFPRFSPQYVSDITYDDEKTYFKGDIAYYEGNFYICLYDVCGDTPNDIANWKLYSDSLLNYTQDSDIVNAFNEAKVNFNEGLFNDEETALMMFLYLTAHYLTIDFMNAAGANNIGIVTSKSVGSVSEGYTIPQWITDSPALSVYASTGYGIKYAGLLRPYLVGNVMLFKGGPTIA